MVRLIWSESAMADLDEIATYIALDSHKYARIQVKRITEKARLLINHPRLGRKVPEFAKPHIREILEGNYRIIYSIDSETQITILSIHHSARLLHADLFK